MEYTDRIYTIEEITAAVEKIGKSYPAIREVVLFGSYVRQEARSCSDIDLLITDPEKVRPMTMFAFLGDVKEELLKPIEVFRLGDVNRQSEFYQNILREGKVVYHRD